MNNKDLESKKYNISGINGPIVYVYGQTNLKMNELVYVGTKRLMGEVIRLDKEKCVIQVYEDTSGLTLAETVESTGELVSIDLAPGIMSTIIDGVARPLDKIALSNKNFIPAGINVSSLDETKKWETEILVKDGDIVTPGQIIAQTQETPLITHKIMIPYDVEGMLSNVVNNGSYTINDTLAKITTKDGKTIDIKMKTRCPIKTPRPVRHRYIPTTPLITGQRIIDSIFPIAKGGAACIPGGFGTGKTMTQHQIAKYSDADIIIYIGCGERGNEMTEVLQDFAKLIDPKTNRPLLDKTLLIANTSNMPVASREASLYTGLTVAEYYRDMGYDVAIMADSTSRWAEALRELSGRLEEMPAEEGFPAYLSSKLSSFYERAGMVDSINGQTGSVTIIGAVSPQGGDFSEPVTQNTKRFVKCFLALDRSLAYARHFPAINWLTSYSEYTQDFDGYYREKIAPDFIRTQDEIMNLLVKENSYLEIVKLIGSDVMPDDQKFILEVARIIRLGFLQQDAFNKIDTSVPLIKQYKWMKVILYFYKIGSKLIKEKIPMSIIKDSDIFSKLISIKYDVDNDDLDFDKRYFELIDAFYDEKTKYNG